jgi:hypothetical protein
VCTLRRLLSWLCRTVCKGIKVPFNQAGDSLNIPNTLGVDVTSRTSAGGAIYTKDSYVQNGYVEQDPNSGELNVVKRPALSTAFGGSGGAYYPAAPGGLCTGQGLFNYTLNGVIGLWGFANNTLWRVDGSTILYGSANVAAWSNYTPSPRIIETTANSSSAIVFKNQIMLVGGIASGSSVYISSVQNSSDGKNWGQLTQAAAWGSAAGLSGRSFPNLAVLNNRLYLMNGNNFNLSLNGGTSFNDCWSTDDGVVWRLETEDMGIAAGFFPRARCATVVFNGTIMMIGGQESTGTTTAITNTILYSYGGKYWAKGLTPSFGARMDHAACVFNGAVYVIGGTDGVGYYTDCWRSFDGQTWTNVYSSGFASGHQFSSLLVYQGRMYAIAYSDNGVNARRVYSSTDGVTWTTVSTGPWTSGRAMAGVVFTAPRGVYPIQYPSETIYQIDQLSNVVYHATLNTNMSLSFPIATAGAVTDQFQTRTMNGGQYLFIKNTSDAWYFTAGTMNKVVDIAYPGSTVPGVAYLNSRVYVMDLSSRIWGSELNDPSRWNGLNFIRADFSGDGAVRLAKHQNYIVAFKVASMMFFYDNGNAIGNTLSPVQNANASVGCAAANTVVEMSNTVFWVSTYGQLRRSVSKLNGLTPQRVSTDDIERLLDTNPFTTVYAMSLKVGGQELYVLTLTDAPATTLVYNNTTGKWSVWASGADGVSTGTLPFRGINRAGLGQITYIQDQKTNGVYALNDSAFQDTDQNAVATAISTVIQPPKVDMATAQPKFCASLDLSGDRYSTSNPVTVTYTDDDWITSTTWGTCDMSLDRPQVYRGGSFRKRGYRFSHTANQPLRLNSYRLTMEPGDI